MSDDETMPSTSTTPTIRVVQRQTFQQLGIAKWLCQQCEQINIKLPSPVQMNCIPMGRDVLGCAKTGTGKTLAFALPIIQKLAVDPYGIFALVLTPTRELAFQIADQFQIIGRPMCLKATIICGGRDMTIQRGDLEKRPHVVISTPGRLADIIETVGEAPMKRLLSKMQFLVLDEADRLLAGQYSEQLKTIFGVVPKQRQTLLFSATLTDALNQLHQVSVRKPYFYQDKEEDNTESEKTVSQLEQRYVLCAQDVKDAYLVYVVREFIERNPASSVLIFTHTCRECQALTGMFRQLGTKCAPLHSLVPQRERLAALQRFRAARTRIMLCTDVAARGLDIANVDLVVNHNVPLDPSTYVHRVGRSARAGRYGAAITFVTQYDINLIHEIEKKIGKKLDELKVSDKLVSQYVTEVLVAKREAEIRLERENFGAKREINKRKQMIMEGMTPEEVDKALEQMKERQKMKSKERVERMEKQIEQVKKKKKVKRVKKKTSV